MITTTPVPGKIDEDHLVEAGHGWMLAYVEALGEEELTRIATAFAMGYAARAYYTTGHDWSQDEKVGPATAPITKLTTTGE